MSYLSLGLDFGTHQSKVCIEDASDPRNITYTFQEFTKPDGGMSYFLPSVVQINQDDTVSYGFCDESRAKEIGFEYILSEPTKAVVPEPKYYIVPPEPIKIGYPDPEKIKASFIRFKNNKLKRKGKKQWDANALTEQQLSEIDNNYKTFIEKTDKQNLEAQEQWIVLKNKVEKRNEENRKLYEDSILKAEEDYTKAYEHWMNSKRLRFATYRYFKIAVFSKEYPWTEEISAKVLSVWYITYLLFHIRQRFGDVPRMQMGIPQSVRDTSLSAWQIQNAKDIFYGAWALMEKTGSLEQFLSLRVDELLSKTIPYGLHRESIPNAPGLLVLPEAFASLESITSQGKLKQSGLHLLVDIGGGSTDISLFYVTDKGKPNISAILSVHKGLNYIFRMYRRDHLEMSLEQIRAAFREEPSSFERYILQYHKIITESVHDNIYIPLTNVTLAANLSVERLKQALYNRPVIYTGGGGVFSVFHRGVHYFQDPLSISRDLLSVRNITNKNLDQSILSILTVAYGLSIPQRRTPEMVPIDLLFKGVTVETPKKGPDYGIDDTD